MIWQQLLDAQRYSRYYNELAARYQKKHRIPRILMAIASVVGTISILLGDSAWISSFLYIPIFLTVLAAIIWDFTCDYGKKASILYSISIECAEIETELNRLWRSLYSEKPLSEDQVDFRLNEIAETVCRITSRSLQHGIPTDDKLNEKAQQEGFKAVSDRFKLESNSAMA